MRGRPLKKKGLVFFEPSRLPSPRSGSSSVTIELGYVGDSGLGARVRFWEYDHSGEAVFPASGVSMDVDTFNVGLEIFERFQFTKDWALEASGGLRYNEFDELMADPIPPAVRSNSFSGWGGIVGLETIRTLGCWGNLYGRARFAVLQDDKTVRNVTPALTQQAILRDTTTSMTEIAVGYEWTRMYSGGSKLFARAGYEWQQWGNFSSSFSPYTTAPGNAPPTFAGSSDVGFSGFGLSLGLEL